MTPPPFRNFSENSSILEGVGFPKLPIKGVGGGAGVVCWNVGVGVCDIVANNISVWPLGR